MIFDFRAVDKKVTFARMVSSKWKIVSTNFFEQTNFEQLIMTLLNGDNIFFKALLFVYVTVTLYSLKKQTKYHFDLKRKIGGRLTILVLHQYSIIFINYLLNDCVLKLKFKFEINNVVHNKEQLKRWNMHLFCNFLLLKYCFSFVRIISTNKIYNLMIERKNLNAE